MPIGFASTADGQGFSAGELDALNSSAESRTHISAPNSQSAHLADSVARRSLRRLQTLQHVVCLGPASTFGTSVAAQLASDSDQPGRPSPADAPEQLDVQPGAPAIPDSSIHSVRAQTRHAAAFRHFCSHWQRADAVERWIAHADRPGWAMLFLNILAFSAMACNVMLYIIGSSLAYLNVLASVFLAAAVITILTTLWDGPPVTRPAALRQALPMRVVAVTCGATAGFANHGLALPLCFMSGERLPYHNRALFLAGVAASNFSWLGVGLLTGLAPPDGVTHVGRTLWTALTRMLRLLDSASDIMFVRFMYDEVRTSCIKHALQLLRCLRC